MWYSPSIGGKFIGSFSVEASVRRLLALLVLALIYSCPLIAQTKTGRERAGLSGPVKAVRVETAKLSVVSGQLVEGQRVPAYLTTFDEQGNTTGQSAHNPDGSLKRKLGWDYTYDAKGREVEVVYRNADGTLTAKGVSTYDSKGRKIEVTLYNPGGSINHHQAYSYDDKGNKIGETHRNPDGTARNNITYIYDGRGNLIEVSYYKPDGTLHQRSIYTYDGQGNETEWAAYNGDGSLAMRRTQSYDDKKNVTEIIYYRKDSSMIDKETFTHLEFDARGNWVKRSTVREVIRDGKSQVETEVTYRHITYF
jgi:hypothetical protein